MCWLNMTPHCEQQTGKEQEEGPGEQLRARLDLCFSTNEAGM